MENIIKIGLLGCGNVGSGVWKLLHDFSKDIAHRTDFRFEVVHVLVRDASKKRDIDFGEGVLTENPDDVLCHPEISIVMEFMGGENPAFSYMQKALENGKTVVTANKVAFALHWPALQEAAKQSGAGLYYEAAVCGALPIIHVMEDSLQANHVDHLYGIVNGTTNYILTRMSQDGEAYENVLADAQKLGLAEPDPTADVEGWDAAYKLSILASLAFHGRVPFENVHVEGISKVQAEDIKWGQELGYTLKLLAIAKRKGLRAETRVHPTFVKNDHPLASVSGSFNAVFLNGHACGDMMFMGRGAGDMPTASALVSDLIRAADGVHRYPTFDNHLAPCVALENNQDWRSAYYIRATAKDTYGVLSKITQTFADHHVSIAAMQQKNHGENNRATVVFITHQAQERDMQEAIASMDADLVTVESMLRVE